MILIYFSKSCWLERLRPKLADMLTIHHGQGVLIIENFQSMFLEEVLEMYFFFFFGSGDLGIFLNFNAKVATYKERWTENRESKKSCQLWDF